MKETTLHSSANLEARMVAVENAIDHLWHVFGMPVLPEPALCLPKQQSGPEALASAYRIVREGRLLTRSANDGLAELRQRVPVDEWQIGGGFCSVPAFSVRIAGVAASSPLDRDTMLAVWTVNAMKALGNVRRAEQGKGIPNG